MRFDLGEKAGEEKDDDRADAARRRTRQQIRFFIAACFAIISPKFNANGKQ